MGFETVVRRFFRAGTERGTATAYAARDGDRWVTTTWAEYVSRVHAAAKGLIALGVEPGRPVSIFGTNQPEWVVFDVAAMAVGAMPAGIYPTNTPDECAYVINHSESPVVLVQNAERLGRILAKRSELPGLRHIVLMGNDPVDADGIMTWDQFVAGGRAVPDGSVEARMEALGPRDGGTLLYTSGTTGHAQGSRAAPRGLELHGRHPHRPHPGGPCRSRHLLPALVPHRRADRDRAHPAVSGHVVYFEPDIKRLAETIKEIRPTAFFAVPRIWEKFYAGASEAVGEATGVKRVIAGRALAVGRRHVDAVGRGEPPGGWLGVQYGLFDRLVYSKAKEKMGLDQARYLFSAAAPLSPTITGFLAGLGMQILNLYGQSECTGLCSFSRPDRNRIGAVGTALPDVELRIAEDGEI